LPVEGQNGSLVGVVEADRPAVTDAQVLIPDATPTLVDGVWTLGWTVQDKTAEEIAEAVDQARTDAKRRMLDWINDFLAPLEAGYSKAEVDAFPAKGPAAENYSAGEARSADMLMLQAEADELGITVAEHVAKILPKSRPYTKAVGITSALRQKTFAQIDAAQPADIPAILEAAKQAAMAKAAELGIA